MKTHAFTWLGLLIVVLGWGLLVVDIVAGSAFLNSGALVVALSLRSDVMTIAQTAILSGFGLAVMGVLISGFGAFSRFFDAVLHRASPPVRPMPPPPLRPEPDYHRAPAPPAPSVVMPVDRAPPPPPPRPLNVKGRNYVVLADGSVEVETLFGPRIFATLDEAREFIR